MVKMTTYALRYVQDGPNKRCVWKKIAQSATSNIQTRAQAKKLQQKKEAPKPSDGKQREVEFCN